MVQEARLWRHPTPLHRRNPPESQGKMLTAAGERRPKGRSGCQQKGMCSRSAVGGGEKAERDKRTSLVVQ